MRRVEAAGPLRATIVLIGEAPGRDDVHNGIPWSGPAGELLDYLLAANDMDRQFLLIDNLRQTYTDDRTEPSILAEVDEFWERYSQYSPIVTVTMGRIATRLFLGDVDMEAVHGVPHDSPYGIVLPVYNPASAFHNAEQGAIVHSDFKILGLIARGDGVKIGGKDELEGREDYAEGFEDWDGDDPVGIDTEGWEDAPWCLTYSVRPGHGRLIRARDLEGIRSFADRLAKVPTVVLHNSLHDLPVLEAIGIEIRDDQLEDTMVMAYNLQTEPQGLKALAARYCGMRMEDYNDVTRPYDEAVCREFLETVMEAIQAGVVEDNPEPVLEEDGKGGWKVRNPQKMQTRVKRLLTKGSDFRKGWDAIDASTRAQAEEVLGPLPRFNFDWVPLENTLYYACRDSDATLRVFFHLTEQLKRFSLEQVYSMDKAIIPMVAAMHKYGIKVDPEYFEWLDGHLTEEMEHYRAIASKYYRKWINPNSPKQVTELLFNRLRMYHRKRTKGGAPSTNDKVLEDLALTNKHPALEAIMEFRGHSKLRDGFARALPKDVGPDGRIRCQFRITRVVSGRLSATSPNLMAIPQREGPLIRQGFVAEDGWVLASADLDQVEMKVMAALSGDKTLVRFMQEGKDIHYETARMIFPHKPYEKSQRDVAKRCGFGVITGITAKGLYDQMRLAKNDEFTVEGCQEVIDGWFNAYPGVKNFLSSCRHMAEVSGRTVDVVGRIRYLPAALFSKSEGDKEEALRQSHSHAISASAQAILKMAMAEIWGVLRRHPDRVRPILQIHDELVFEVRRDHTAWLEKLVLKALTKNRFGWPVELTASMKFADRWGELK